MQPYVNAGMTSRTGRGLPRKPIPIPDLPPGAKPPAAKPKSKVSTALADPLAPLSETQIQARAHDLISSETTPILDQIKKLFADRSATGSAAITGYTKALAGDLGQYMDRARQTYGQAQSDQANVDAAVSSELHGGGSEVAKALSSRLGAAGLDPAMVASLAAGAESVGAGSAGAQYAQGSAELSKLIGEGAHAQEYAGKLPGLAALSGLQKTKDLQAQLDSELSTQVGDISSKLPSSIASLVDSMRNREVQKAIARESGLLNTTKAKQSSTYQTKTLTERQRHDRAQEQAARQRIAAQKQAADDKAANTASTSAEKQSKGEQKAFYSTRDKVFNEAKQLYKGDSSAYVLPGTGGKTAGPATTAEAAYSKLWNQYAVPLIAEYGFQKSVLDTMIRRALRTAGWTA